MIEEAEALLLRASGMGVIGRFQLEAVVQSAHAARRHSGRTDSQAIEHAYDLLWDLTNSPVVAINRAIAIAERGDAYRGLAALNAVAADARLRDYQPYWAARALLLTRTDEVEEADAAFRQAIGLEKDPAVRRFLQRRRAELASRGARHPSRRPG
jgi:RNA polymerase sigma-70 factor, ECF subfamily